VEFVWDGRIRKQYEDVEKMPIEVLVDTFKISGGSFSVDYKSNSKKLMINGKELKWGVWNEVEGNRIYVQRKEGIKEEQLQVLAASSAHTLGLNLYSLGDAANRIKSSFVAEPDKKEYLLNLILTSTNINTGKRWLSGIIVAYQLQTQAEKRKKNQLMLEFIDDRLNFVGQDLDSIEGSLVNFKKVNNVEFLSMEAQRALAKVSEGDKQTSQLDLQLYMLDHVEQYVKGRIGKPGMLPVDVGIQNGLLTELILKLYEAEQELAHQVTTVGPNSDLLKPFKAKISSYKIGILESIANTRNQMKLMKSRADDDFQ
jgi:hypothetical protein